MRYASGERVQLGDSAEVGAGLRGTVVCVIDGGQFTAEYSEADWSYLRCGALIQTDEAGMVHCDDGRELFLIERTRVPRPPTGNADATP
jgi:hypothetical protein